jgi:uncharacterized membrane protein YcgQ (UPF0703/DUF1980 family)
MNNEEKREKLNLLYELLDGLKNKKDKYSTNLRQDIRKKIKDIKYVMTDEDWQEMMESRSEIDTRKC